MARNPNSDYQRALQPRFSLNRALVDLTHGGLSAVVRDGIEAAGGKLDSPHKVEIPWRAFAATRDLVAGTASAGGFLVATNTYTAADALRPLSALFAAGVRTAEGLTGNGLIPKVSASATAEWLLESEATTPSSPTVGMVSVSPHMASAYVRFSRLLDLQSADMERALRSDMLGVVAALLDAGLIGGSGSDGAPRGLIHAAGNSEAGGSLDWADIQAMLGHVREGGGLDANIHWLTSPDVAELLGKRECASGNGGFILATDGTIAGRPCHISRNCPDATLVALDNRAVTAALFGAGPTLELNPYGANASDFKTGIREGRVMVACDVAVTNPDGICIATSVT